MLSRPDSFDAFLDVHQITLCCNADAETDPIDRCYPDTPADAVLPYLEI